MRINSPIRMIILDDYFKGSGTVNYLFFKRQMLSVKEDDVGKKGWQSLSNEKASTCIDADARCYFMNVFLIFRSTANNHFQYGNDNGKQRSGPESIYIKFGAE
ncbi:hypothetical protein D3C73_514870 [compost metagenome]